MLIKPEQELKYSDVTPKRLYQGRRSFLLGMLGATGALAAWKGIEALAPRRVLASGPAPLQFVKWPYSTTEAETKEDTVTHYNNFYEFGTDKADPANNAQNFNTSGWSVRVDGEVAKPRSFTLDELMKLAPLEERIYRHRCVEGWSIVVPWIGFPLSVLANQVQPTPKAKFVAFESYYDQRQMPRGPYSGIQLPYLEGLRLDEAMNPLALLTFGMYGETLPNQDGAPVRIVLPWKYGFKSAKSLVKISFVKNHPPTAWNMENAHEYGFYSNVNPNVDHPRWSQATERRLGDFFRRKTLMFNGYGDQVASMYNGMDLRVNY
ncbi:MAG: protein-methionine-sulfoxide reductase catalytic subunit MsrP [Candidatus Acidiferrales bacterium]|jgi:sulfoxide reductase catalytic subunit YedY